MAAFVLTGCMPEPRQYLFTYFKMTQDILMENGGINNEICYNMRNRIEFCK